VIKNDTISDEPAVILLHGLLASSINLIPLALRLKKKGFRVYNWGYNSRSADLDLLSERIWDRIRASNLLEHETLHFVTHSMGGIVLRQLLHHHSVPQLGRIVMMCPPNLGSEMADHLAEKPFWRWLLGPAVEELKTDGKVLTLGSVPAQVGILAGEQPGLFSSLFFQSANDGRVAVEHTVLPEMQQHEVLPYGHTLFVFRPQVQEHVIRFLLKGHF